MHPLKTFKLSDSDLLPYIGKQPKWDNLLAYITYQRTYSRTLEDGSKEEYWQTLRRVVEGVFSVQKNHCKAMHLPWTDGKAKKSALEMMDQMWNFKWLPPGRGLWMMGTDYMFEKGSAALMNCYMVSTEDINTDFSGPFCFLMDRSMLGGGVGFDLKGAGQIRIKTPRSSKEVHEVEDSREGWVEIVRRVLDAYVGRDTMPANIDYSKVRKAGEAIKNFGGISAGPEPLMRLIESLQKVLDRRAGEYITSVDILDIMNNIGCCVVSGNVRRSSEIAFGFPNDISYISAKDPDLFPSELRDYRYVSNNSVFCTSGMDYSELAARTVKNGEPGYIWLDNCRNYGRMIDGKNGVDFRTVGTNPCQPGFATVLTPEGIKTFDDIRTGSIIWSGKEWTKVVNKVHTGRKEVFKYYTSAGIFVGTPDHRIVQNGEKIEVCNAKTIDVCTNVPFPDGASISSAIERVTSVGVHDVYDITVEADDHTYWSGGLLVSNCGEIALESYESCVTGDTKIQTRFGVVPIASVLNTPVEVWNGKAWSTVKPFKTSSSSEIFRVTFSDGSYLDCTDYHRFSLLDGQTKKTMDLRIGDQLQKFSLGRVEGKHEPKAYEYGLFAGDGFIEKNKAFVNMQIDHLDTVQPNGIQLNTMHENMQKVILDLDLDICNQMKDYLLGLPQPVMTFNEESILQFVAGFIDKAGSIVDEGYRVYGFEPKLRDLQLLLRRANIDYATFTDKGAKYLTIHACDQIPTRLKKAKSCAWLMTPQEVVSITLIGEQPTYCFHEKDEGMGVFGNVLTYQCNLTETFPAHHRDLDDFKRTLKMAYMYAKTVTLLPTHDDKANAVIMRNRRIGLSQSGIVQAIDKFGYRNYINMCDEAYRYVQEMDKKYSGWLCIPQSIKTTTVKPSGTVSILAGATPGVHFPHSQYYIRRIRFGADDPLVAYLTKRGYTVEDDYYSTGAKVVGFPIEVKNFSRGKTDVSIWEMTELVANMQAHWADNAVSCTVDFKPEEAKDVARLLSYYEDRLKTISFLPNVDHGYKQLPYEAISEEQYKTLIASLKDVSLKQVGKTEHLDTKGCDNDLCTL